MTYKKNYYQENKEKYKERHRLWMLKNPNHYNDHKEEYKEQIKRWHLEHPSYNKLQYEKHKEKYKERHRLWMLKNPNYYKNNQEKLKAYQKRWHLEHPNYFKEYSKSPKGILKRKVYKQKFKEKINLKRTLKRYNLTLEEYNQITTKCFLCGFNKYRVDIHHKDKNKSNLDKSNLVGLCPNCHMGTHRGKILLI